MGKNLDKELADAVGLGDDSSHDPNDDANMAIPSPDEAKGEEASGKKNLGLLIGLLVIVAGIVSLFMFGFKDVEVYSMTLEKFVANQDEYASRRVRIEGELVPNSLKKRDDQQGCEYKFMLRDAEARLEVRFPQCVVPEAFQDRGQPGVMVTAEGKMKEGYFEASMILAKCASKYDPKTHTFEGQEQAKAPTP